MLFTVDLGSKDLISEILNDYLIKFLSFFYEVISLSLWMIQSFKVLNKWIRQVSILQCFTVISVLTSLLKTNTNESVEGESILLMSDLTIELSCNLLWLKNQFSTDLDGIIFIDNIVSLANAIMTTSNSWKGVSNEEARYNTSSNLGRNSISLDSKTTF